ncbi:unnamed protein product [Pleuronectes platessa]|uniref:Uncharacterized protein n=1 Tax=Pleuronectes platessa TaxID=8262 RepID=A0A9N7TVS1_PLEPL|nr:unnamed protein product [Pleuronectes platessa]
MSNFKVHLPGKQKGVLLIRAAESYEKINDRPKPSGSPSHSTASAGAVTGPPNLPLLLGKSMCETPASHAGVCLGERLGVNLVGEAQPFTQGSGQHPRGLYHSSISFHYPEHTGAVLEQGNETTCQGGRTKREHVEQRIRLGGEVWGCGEREIKAKGAPHPAHCTTANGKPRWLADRERACVAHERLNERVWRQSLISHSHPVLGLRAFASVSFLQLLWFLTQSKHRQGPGAPATHRANLQPPLGL